MNKKKIAVVGGLSLLLAGQSLRAASETWTGGTNADGNFSDGANWTNPAGTMAPPGTVGTTTPVSTSDTAFFITAPGTYGTGANPIVIDKAFQSIGNLAFGAAVGSYTIGTTGGNSLYVYGIISLGVNASSPYAGSVTSGPQTETINAPIVSETNSTFRNDSTGANASLLNFNGNLSAGAGQSILLRGASTLANTVSGVISNGTVTNLSIQKTDNGTWNLSNSNNSFTGLLGVFSGTLGVSSLSNEGSISAIGQGSSATTNISVSGSNVATSDYNIVLGQNGSGNAGTLQYNGTGNASSNRPLLINNGTNGTSGGGGVLQNVTAGTTVTYSGGLSTSSPGVVSTLSLNGVGNGALTGGISGSPALTVTVGSTAAATGTWTFGGTNTYTGTTSVVSGMLALQGTLANASSLAVSANGTFAGNFALGSAAGAGAVASQTIFNLTLTGTGAGANKEPILSLGLAGGTSSDHLTASNTLTLTGSTFELNLSGATTGAYTLLTWTAAGSTAITTGNVDLVLNGTDLGTSNSDLSIVANGANNNLVFSTVPEPSSWATLLLGCAGVLVVAQRHRRMID